MRVRIDMEEDFKIIERTVRRYHFNLLDEQVEDLDNTWVEGGKRKLISRHQVKRNKGGEASTSATAAAARVDNSSNDDAVVVNLEDDFEFSIDK
nr:unnamed protein product [Callosobruchus analis]